MKKNYENCCSLPKSKRTIPRSGAFTGITVLMLVLVSIASALANDNNVRTERPWSKKSLLYEIKSKRTRTSKHFMSEDNKISAFISPSSIHYLGKGNNWEEIETGITPNTGTNLNSHPFAAERNAVKNYFPKNPFLDYVLMDTKEGRFKERIVAIRFCDAAGQSIGSVPVSGAINISLSGNKISYSGFHPDLKLEYSLGNDSRKFDLIVLSNNFLNSIPATAQTIVIEEEFLSENEACNVKALKNIATVEYNGISVFQIASPVAYGSNNLNEEFIDGKLSIARKNNTTLFLSSFPLAWIQDNSRHFPVHLDPTVNYYPSNTTYWTGYQTSATTKTSGQIRVTNGLNQGWAKFDLSSLPVGCTVSQATYYGYHYSTTSTTKICQITGMGTVEPVSATAGAIAAQIPSGTQYNGNYTFGGATYSWNPGLLNSSGMADIAAAAGNWIALGFSYLSGSTTFMYHYGINGFGLSPTPMPCYIEVIYFTVPCNSVPSANSVISPTYAICPGTSVVLTLANTYSVGGINYQWLSSSSSSVGPFVSIPNGTAATLNTPTVSTPTWFSVVITCSSVIGNYTATAGEVLVEPVTIDNVPYYESFETINYPDELPNCSWSASNPGTTAQTYTAATTDNRVPRTGSKFASFYYSPVGSTYFYTNGIQMNAGITYSASLWYTTEYVGYNNWSDLSILFGTSQNSAGLSSIASTNGPAISNIYKLLSDTFSVPASGVYYVAIKATTGSGSAQYLSWDDLQITIPCSLNSPSLTLVANSTTICSGETVNLLATGADSYAWSTGSLFDNISETPPSTVTYTVTGTNTLSGCSASVSKKITVNTSPNVYAFSSPQTICANSSAVLQVFGANSYVWNQNSTASVFTVAPLTTTVYSVTGTALNGCTGNATVLVQVNPLPNVGITGPSSAAVCVGEPFLLNASGASTFSWTNSSNLNFMTGNPLSLIAWGPTTFTVLGTDIFGCENTATYILNTSECTGLHENTGNSFSGSIFPNPGTGIYTVKTKNEGDKHLRVLDLTGKTIFTSSFRDEEYEMNLKSLASGVYLIELLTPAGTSYTKIIKQ